MKRSMLDKSTLAKVEILPELRPKNRTFAAITAFVEELHIESPSNKLFSRVVRKGDAMDVGAVTTREPSPRRRRGIQQRNIGPGGANTRIIIWTP